MADRPLQGVGVLVTRPRIQANELVNAIEAQGGHAFCFPVIEIAPFDTNIVDTEAAALERPDIVIFVSRNAVEYGIRYTDGGLIAVIGPATANAVRAAGRVVDIQPASGFDSEHLLAEELTARGALVDYVSVYERRQPEPGPETLAELESQWRQGHINVVTVMSVQSLTNLIDMLPAWCGQQLELTPLVTPAGRVLKEALDRYPASRPILAPGPGADDMVKAIIALHSTDSGIAP